MGGGIRTHVGLNEKAGPLTENKREILCLLKTNW